MALDQCSIKKLYYSFIKFIKMGFHSFFLPANVTLTLSM